KQLPLPENFNFSPSLAIASLSFKDASLSALVLTLTEEIQNGVIYTITASNIFDCAGNVLMKEYSSVIFGLPEEANSHDVVVNEILFNPRPTGTDFVEVINISDKFINLRDWKIGNLENGELVDASPITTDDVLIEPNGILLFTENGNRVKGEYVIA